MDLKGKNAIITGCNRGIGKEIMKAFAEHGANVWACARKQTNEYEIMIGEVASTYGVKIMPLYFDIANEEEIKCALKQIQTTKKPVDILVNNAGMAHGGTFQMTSIEVAKEVFNVNYFSQLNFTQKVLRFMSRQKKGSIINICSVMGIDCEKGTIAYGGSKAALIQATKVLAKELGEINIRVNAIAPGIVDTEMFTQMDERVVKNILDNASLHRIAETSEIATAAVFLASEAASYITGQVLRVDGGM